MQFVGRSAELTEVKKSIGTLSPGERREVGQSFDLAGLPGGRRSRPRLPERGSVSAGGREERLREEAVDVLRGQEPRSRRASLHRLPGSSTR